MIHGQRNIRFTSWDVYTCLAHHPTVSGTKSFTTLIIMFRHWPEIQQNESSPSHCAVYWHSFLCTPNLPKCSFVLFSVPKFCMCLSHFTCMQQAPPISPSFLWSLPYCNVKSRKYIVPRSTIPCSPVILTPSEDQFFPRHSSLFLPASWMRQLLSLRSARFGSWSVQLLSWPGFYYFSRSF